MFCLKALTQIPSLSPPHTKKDKIQTTRKRRQEGIYGMGEEEEGGWGWVGR